MSRAWDQGIAWRTIRLADDSPGPDLVVNLDYVRDRVLRVTNGVIEDEHIETLIEAATDMAEDWMECALRANENWQQIMSGFPSSYIELQRPPLIEVVSLEYFDAGGVFQSLSGSPTSYQVLASGPVAKARIYPLASGAWPATEPGNPNAVTVTFRAGYATPEIVPAMVRAGIGLVVGELYNNQALSVTSLVNNTKTVLQLERFWKKVY